MIDIQVVWSGETHSFSLDDGEHQVGRSSHSAVHLPAPRVSKEHAVLRVAGDRMWVRDLGSTNGTEVNGRRIGSDEVEVPTGTLVSFAGAMMRRAGAEADASAAGMTVLNMPMTGSAEAILSYNSRQGFSGAGGDRVLRLISGLFELLAQGKGREAVENEACAFVAEHITADRVVILGEGGSALDVRARWTRGNEDPNTPLHLSSTVVGRVVEGRESVLVSNILEDERFAAQQSVVALNLRSAMAAPLFDNERVRGILYVDTSQPGVRYAQADLEVLTATANAVAVKLRNIHFESELRTAADIQQLMMPKQPSVPGYDIAALCVPARGVGGDYFDFIPARENRVALAVGDVSGKGLPAALLMANVHATIRAQTQIGDAITDRIGRANRLVCETTSFESFVTLFYGELDPARHQFTYCNAGHEHPFLITRSGTRRLGTNGLALGVIEDFVFAEEAVSVAPGDLLVVYSDGVTDTPDDAGDLFGTERLQRVIGDHRSSPADRIARAVIDEVTAHGGGKVQFDDLTVLVLRRDAEHTMV